MVENRDICSEAYSSEEKVCITSKILSLRDLCNNELAKWLRTLKSINDCVGEKGIVFIVVDDLEDLYVSTHNLLLQSPHLLDLAKKLGFNNFVCILDKILELLKLNEEIQRVKDKYGFAESFVGIRGKLRELLDKRDQLLIEIGKYYDKYSDIVATIIDNVKTNKEQIHKNKRHQIRNNMIIIHELRKSFSEYLEDIKIIPLSTLMERIEDVNLGYKYTALKKYAMKKLGCHKVIIIDGEEMEIINKILNLGFTIKVV